MISFALGETRKFTFTGSMAEAVLRSFEHYKSLKEAEFQGQFSKSRRHCGYDWEDKVVHEFEINPVTLNYTDRDRLMEQIKSDAAYMALRMKRGVEILEDYEAMEASLQHFRHRTGIDEMQSFIQRKRPLLSLLETLDIQSAGAGDDLEVLLPNTEQLKSAKFNLENKLVINYRFWDTKEIQQLVGELKRQIMDCMKKIDEIKSTQTLEVQLRSSSVELLGLG